MKVDTKWASWASQPETAYIGLGSNMGDREQYLRAAICMLNEDEEIAVRDLSAIYETDPVGPVEQAAFLNMAAKLETTLSPEALLDRLLQTEAKLGRVRVQKWGPRTIDLDLLLYGRQQVNSENLIVPHPHMWERSFVLVPLSDILRYGEEPRFDAALSALDIEGGKNGVRLWKVINWPEEFALSAN